MRFLIKHEGKGRLRVHVNRHSLTYAEADILQMYLENVPGIQEVKVYERSADAAIVYRGGRDTVLQALQKFGFDRGQVPETAVAGSSREINAEYKEKLIDKIIIYYGKRWLLPMPIRSVITTVKSVKYIAKGVKTLWQRRIEVPVLDATAIGVSVLRSDFATAGSIMFLLEIGELLEEWTHKKSVEDLARSMSLQTTKVWLVTEDGEDVQISTADVKAGDKIILPRNVHKSVINALVLCGGIPIYVNPEMNQKLGISLGMQVEKVKQAIEDNPDAVAVFVNNPTYYGICSDIKTIVQLAHARGMKVLADEAHGTHLYFGKNLPISAMAAGADMAHPTRFFPALISQDEIWLSAVRNPSRRSLRWQNTRDGRSTPSAAIMLMEKNW